jgi:pyruvate formate lyase activating enzyme
MNKETGTSKVGLTKSGPEAKRRSGLIFDIQRFSLHDGPGIRSTVFLKGCPLHCQWCSNPESINAYPEIMAYDTKCIRCGQCGQVCPKSAITIVEDVRKIDWSNCDLCLECVKACASGAIEQVGKYMSVDEVVEEIAKDFLFYRNSGGGVTLSGGEPLLQWEFAIEVLRQCQERGIHTALDTSGYTNWEIMEQVLEYVNLVLFDIKHMNPGKHKEGTGVDNTLILDNAVRTAGKVRTWIRVPVITGYNDSESNIRELAEFIAKLPIEKVSLLPYHCWGEQKYQRLGRSYHFKNTLSPTDEEIQKLQEIMESYKINVTISR